MIEIRIKDVDVEFRSSGGLAVPGPSRLFKHLNVTLNLEPGEILGLMGESGSGKSTFLRLIANVLPCNVGEISISSVARGDIAFLPQGGVLLEHLSLRENLALFAQLKITEKRYKQERLDAAINALDLTTLCEDNRSLDKLSGGERQRVSLARVLSIEPRLVLLDEPCAAIGGDHRKEFLTALKKSAVELEFAVILASHDWEDHVLAANKVAFLKNTNGVGLSSVPLVRVSEFAFRPWHQEAIAYTAGAPVNWIGATRGQARWTLSAGGCPLGEAGMTITRQANQESKQPLDRVLLACTPEKFSKSATPNEDPHWRLIGKSDLYAFVAAGTTILVLPSSIVDLTHALQITGSIPVYAEDGNLIGVAEVHPARDGLLDVV